MKNLKIIAAMFATVITISTFAAEAPPQRQNVNTVTLVLEESSKTAAGKKLPTYQRFLEGDVTTKYIVPRDVAKQAKSIKYLIEEFPDNKEIAIGTKVSPIAMEYIKNIMWSIHKHNNLSGKGLLDQLEKDISINQNDAFDLLYAANYLDFDAALSFVARTIVKNKTLIARVEKGGIFGFLKKENPVIKDLMKNIGWYHYLINRRDLQGIDHRSYSFSVQDYLDYYPQIFAEKYNGNQLNLDSLQLYALDGLSNIPNIHTVDWLHLSNNKLTTLPENIFIGLNNIKNIDFSYSMLTTIHAGAFNGLTNLQQLYLSYNHLATLPVNVFNSLINLKGLTLSNNLITTLPETLFAGLIDLRTLSLDHNKLSAIPENIFHGLTQLRILALQDNRLHRLSGTIFQDLVFLVSLFLSNNQLSELPAGIFNDLLRLGVLDISHNPLTHIEPALLQPLHNLQNINLKDTRITAENRQQLRAVLPHQVLGF